MINNHIYNLLLQLTEENKSLWRIKEEYIKDAEGCESCTAFWKNLEEQKEKHVEELREMVKKHL